MSKRRKKSRINTTPLGAGSICLGSRGNATSTAHTPNEGGKAISRIPSNGRNQDLSFRSLPSVPIDQVSSSVSAAGPSRKRDHSSISTSDDSSPISAPVAPVTLDSDDKSSGSFQVPEEPESAPEPVARKRHLTRKKMKDELKNQIKKYKEELTKERSAHQKTKAKLETRRKKDKRRKRKLMETEAARSKLVEDLEAEKNSHSLTREAEAKLLESIEGAKKEPTTMINSLLSHHGDGRFMAGYPQEAVNGRTLLDNSYALKSNGKVEKRSDIRGAAGR